MSNKTLRICKINPVNQRPYAVSKWFVPPPGNTRFTPRGGNQIQLLNCGEEYLPKLYAAIEGAKQSIYIAIWGFNPELPLRLNSANRANRLGDVLQRKAEQDGVEIKILVWYNPIANIASKSAGDQR